jgi:hypothetical protein
MTTAELDAALRRLTAASEAIGVNLLDLERDPTGALLEAATLTGETARAWASATQLLGSLWQRFTRLNELLERAASLRGSRSRLSPDREAELTTLLCGPSIELDPDHVPLGQRALLGERQTTTRVAPDELLALMSESFEQVMVVVTSAGSAWEALVPRVNRAREVLAELSEQGATTDGGLDVASLDRKLDAVADVLATDPMSASRDEIDAIETELAQLQAGLAAADELRAALADRITRARVVRDEVRSELHRAVEAYDEVRVKIGARDVPVPPEVDIALDAQLDAVVALADQCRWQGAEQALDEWQARVDELLDRARESVRASRAQIEARNELRGRLDAYQAMAQAYGVLEARDVSDCYERARTALYTAPTDLQRAASLVRAYQDSLSGREAVRRELT